jgi:glutamate---cysteine ligase / carboxylate-amine ligase
LWARWNGELDQRYTLGIEEELMLLEPDVIALVALIQSLARLELEGESPLALPGPEVLAENRFRAARDGMDARLIDPTARCLIPVRESLDALLAECRPHALALACADALDDVPRLAAANGADRQRAVVAGDGRLDRLVAKLADRFLAPARLPASGLAA